MCETVRVEQGIAPKKGVRFDISECVTLQGKRETRCCVFYCFF